MILQMPWQQMCCALKSPKPTNQFVNLLFISKPPDITRCDHFARNTANILKRWFFFMKKETPSRESSHSFNFCAFAKIIETGKFELTNFPFGNTDLRVFEVSHFIFKHFQCIDFDFFHTQGPDPGFSRGSSPAFSKSMLENWKERGPKPLRVWTSKLHVPSSILSSVVACLSCFRLHFQEISKHGVESVACHDCVQTRRKERQRKGKDAWCMFVIDHCA